MPTPELDILKPIDEALSNSDDYEIYTLSNAHVTHMSNGKPASLLSAYADKPLKVEGRLEPLDRNQQQNLLKRPYKPKDVEIKDVTRFSYGQTADGDIVLWALGRAGWFEIQPALAYKGIYQEIEQAVQLLYFITDIHEQSRARKKAGPNAELVFREYSEDGRFNCTSPNQARLIFNKHRRFLIVCMLTQAQGIKWSNTHLYQYFKSEFPNDVVNAKLKMQGKDESDALQRTNTQKPKPSKPKSKTSNSDAPKRDDNWWEASVIWEFMQKVVNLGLISQGHVTIERVAPLFIKEFDVDAVEAADHYIRVRASNLCYMMKHPRRRSSRFFADEPIFQQLSAGPNLSAADVRKAEQMELKKRKTYESLNRDTYSDMEESTDETPTPPRRGRSSKGTFSALRPKSSKFTGKSGKGKQVKAPSPAAQSPAKDDDNMGAESGNEEKQKENKEPANDASDIEMHVDPPTQGPSPGKRKRTDLDTNPRKRAASQSEPEVEDSPESLDEEDDEEPEESDEESEVTEPLPLRWRSNNVPTSSRTIPASTVHSAASASAVVPPIISTPLPTTAANGHGDTWICHFDGCVYKVYGASKELGKGLIKDHLHIHGGRPSLEGDKRMEVLLREQQRLRLPVNNLIKRIREISDAQQPLFPSSMAPAVPTEIDRKL